MYPIMLHGKTSHGCQLRQPLQVTDLEADITNATLAGSIDGTEQTAQSESTTNEDAGKVANGLEAAEAIINENSSSFN
jgi:hypothetical protein